MADKDVAGVVAALARLAASSRARRIIATAVDDAAGAAGRPSSRPSGSAGSGRHRDRSSAEPGPRRGPRSRRWPGRPGPLVVAGSLYLVGAVRARLVDDPLLRDPGDHRPR